MITRDIIWCLKVSASGGVTQILWGCCSVCNIREIYFFFIILSQYFYMLQHRRSIGLLNGASTLYTEVQILLLDQPKDLKSMPWITNILIKRRAALQSQILSDVPTKPPRLLGECLVIYEVFSIINWATTNQIIFILWLPPTQTLSCNWTTPNWDVHYINANGAHKRSLSDRLNDLRFPTTLRDISTWQH